MNDVRKPLRTWTDRTDAEMKRSPKILILGGGFAGVEVARELEKLLTPDEAIIQLVSRNNFVPLYTDVRNAINKVMAHECAICDVRDEKPGELSPSSKIVQQLSGSLIAPPTIKEYKK